MSFGHSLRRAGFDAPTLTLSNFCATQYTEPERVEVARPALPASASSERWQQEQTRPEPLAVHVVEADRASGCASSVRTASRSSCAHVATSQSPRCGRAIWQCLGNAHGYRAGSCVMVPLGRTAVLAQP